VSTALISLSWEPSFRHLARSNGTKQLTSARFAHPTMSFGCKDVVLCCVGLSLASQQTTHYPLAGARHIGSQSGERRPSPPHVRSRASPDHIAIERGDGLIVGQASLRCAAYELARKWRI